MTEILNGDFDNSALLKSGSAEQAAAAIPAEARKLRLVLPSMILLSLCAVKRWPSEPL
jgi:hypothetical protein